MKKLNQTLLLFVAFLSISQHIQAAEHSHLKNLSSNAEKLICSYQLTELSVQCSQIKIINQKEVLLENVKDLYELTKESAHELFLASRNNWNYAAEYQRIELRKDSDSLKSIAHELRLILTYSP